MRFPSKANNGYKGRGQRSRFAATMLPGAMLTPDYDSFQKDYVGEVNNLCSRTCQQNVFRPDSGCVAMDTFGGYVA